MRYLFLGAGGVGGYFGGRMAEAGREVTFLVRPARAAQLAHGLKIESPLGDATVPVQTIVEGDDASPVDVIVLACKAHGLHGAIDSLVPHVRNGTVILPLLNGYDHLEALEASFPGAIVLGGAAGISAVLTDDGTVRHLDPDQDIALATRPGQEAHRDLAKTVVSDMSVPGINPSLAGDIDQMMWEKWIFLAAFAASTCLMQGTVGVILAAEGGPAFMRALLDECERTAKAEGHAFSENSVHDYRGILFTEGLPATASMYRDMHAGNPTEADHVIGAMIRRAARNKIATPLLAAAHVCLQVYETARTG